MMGSGAQDAPQVRMRCECNLGNCARECQTARMATFSGIEPHERGENVDTRSRDKTGRKWASIAISIGYYYMPPIALGSLTLKNESRV
eukprot:6194927-Pleurochrysis_carterae.AAC.1